MATVYQNALVTIAVLNGADSHSGFLKLDEVDEITIPWFEQGADASNRLVGSITATPCLPFEYQSWRSFSAERGLQQEMKESRWATRGWTYQESLLSRRILYFGTYQMYWDCQKETASEDGWDAKIDIGSEKSTLFEDVAVADNFAQLCFDALQYSIGKDQSRLAMTHNLQSRLRLTAKQAVNKALGTSRIIKGAKYIQRKVEKAMPTAERGGIIDKYSIIREYTERNFTVSTDKLIAFEGLVLIIARRPDQTVHAGLWSGTLAHDLFWFACRSGLTRPSLQRAPSWSWAAFDGEIRGPGFGLPADLDTHDDLYWESSTFGGDLQNIDFIPDNFQMSTARGVKPLSMEVSGFRYAAQRSDGPYNAFPQTKRELNEIIGIWPWQRDWPEDWPESSTHLLYINPALNETKSKDTPPAKSYACPSCKQDLGCCNEMMIVSHVERCDDSDSSTSEVSSERERKASLCGIAVFDIAAESPPSFQALVLWHRTENQTSWQPDPPKRRFLDAIYPGDDDESIYRVLHPDHSSLLAMQRTEMARMVSVPTSFIKGLSRGKRTYFLLLISETERPGTFQRVGVGITYWLPGAPRFGGLPLHKMSERQRIVLV